MEIPTVTFSDPDKSFRRRGARPQFKKRAEQVAELNMDKTRHEIMKFAVNSLKNEEKIDAEEKLAIELGARRPKGKFVNYKVVLEQKKKEKLEKLEAVKNQKPIVSKNKVQKKSNKSSKKAKIVSKRNKKFIK